MASLLTMLYLRDPGEGFPPVVEDALELTPVEFKDNLNKKTIISEILNI